MSKKNKKPNGKSKTIEKSEFQTFDIVKVYWKDHFSGNRGWVSEASDLRTAPMICTSVGFQVHESEETLTLAQNMGENMNMADCTTILKNCITSRKVIGQVVYDKKAKAA